MIPALLVANIITWSFCVGANLDNAIAGEWWGLAFVATGVVVVTTAALRLRKWVAE